MMDIEFPVYCALIRRMFLVIQAYLSAGINVVRTRFQKVSARNIFMLGYQAIGNQDSGKFQQRYNLVAILNEEFILQQSCCNFKRRIYFATKLLQFQTKNLFCNKVVAISNEEFILQQSCCNFQRRIYFATGIYWSR